jgi:hypothetical protein
MSNQQRIRNFVFIKMRGRNHQCYLNDWYDMDLKFYEILMPRKDG